MSAEEPWACPVCGSLATRAGQGWDVSGDLLTLAIQYSPCGCYEVRQVEAS